MALSDLNDPEVVRKAVAEFDRIGREAFLAKYDFGKARDYFLAHGGGRYDSKAIIGAAHSYQFPDREALTHRAFQWRGKESRPDS